jgi:hypothetical protein
VNTIAPPTTVVGCSRQLQAVTWNSGVGAMNTGGRASGTEVGASTSPAAMALASAAPVTAVQKTMFRMLWIDPRCVSWAPFGNPVVPEV